ncbi:MAG: ribbon-helix-helix domain-containing protein [Shimia sp.]
MPTYRRLTREDRLAIVREAANGVGVQALADKHGVTKRTVYYTLRRERDRRRDASHRSVTLTVTVTPDEAAAFDALWKGQGIGSRSDALRRLIRASDGVFQPDEALADELRRLRAALNQAGNNVTQIAKRLNEARQKGIAPAFGVASLAQVRALARFVLTLADEVDLLVRRRSRRITLVADGALKEFAHAEE